MPSQNGATALAPSPTNTQPELGTINHQNSGAAGNASTAAVNKSNPAPTQSASDNLPPQPARPANSPQSQPKSGTIQPPNGARKTSPKKEVRFEGKNGG